MLLKIVLKALKRVNNMKKSVYIKLLKRLTNWCFTKNGNFLVSISRKDFMKTICNVYSDFYLENADNSKGKSVFNVGENESSLDITVTYDISRGLVSITDYRI